MKINSFFKLFIIVTFCASCNKKDNFNYPAGTVGISKVTYFPIIALKGNAYISVAIGGTFSDPGVTATAGGQTVPVTISGSVDVNTAGVYTLTYTATNSDGFNATVNRNVIVYSTDPAAAAIDLSGDYARSTNGVIATWTRLAPGVYKVLNPGGSPAGTTLTVIAFNPAVSQILIPHQALGDGSVFYSSNESFNAGPPITYQWKINNVGYGTAIRTFTKI